MKIVHSTIRYPPARGGVESYVAGMVEGLADRGHEVVVSTSRLSQHMEGMRRLLSDEELTAGNRPGVLVRRHRHFEVPGLGAYPAIPGIWKDAGARGVDLVHAHCFYYSSCDIASAGALRRRTPLVVSPHLPARTKRRWATYRRAMRWIVERADVVTTLTEFERRFLVESGLEPRKTLLMPPAVQRVEPLGFDIESFLPAYDPTNSKLLLSVGRITDTKGVDTVLGGAEAVVRAHPEAHFVFIGPVGEADRNRYELEIEHRGIQGHVSILGEVPDMARAGLYAAASALLFPSRYEAYGIVALEAMAAGVPVIASDAASIPEVLDYGRLGRLHAVGNSDRLAAEVNELLDDERAAAELRAVGLKHIAEHHTPEAQITRLEEAYALAAEGKVR